MDINMLYVDDDDITRDIVESICKASGFIVATAQSGQEALSLVRHVHFDLILLDVVMPGLDGPGTLELLRAQELYRLTPIAFLTAHAQETELSFLRERDVMGVLAKPFDPRALPGVLQSMANNARYTSQYS
jgi:CheY-like chemotaxis protein